MPSRCVLYGCSNYPDAKNQIALHPIPFYGDQWLQAAKRKRWVDFVKQKRAKETKPGVFKTFYGR